MSRAAWSIAAFGAYMLATGLLLTVAPPAALRHADPQAPYEPVRLLGILTAVVGGYYLAAARGELRPFFRYTVVGRATAAAAMLALVLSGNARAPLLLVGTLDLLGALWTASALRRGRSAIGATR